MANILTLTLNPAVDRAADVRHITPEDKLRCKNERLDPGGGGLNVCRAVKNLGGEAEAIYTSGGPLGDILQVLLDKAQVNHQAIAIQQWTRENFVVLEEVSGKEYRFNMPGPTLAESEWRQALQIMEARVVPDSYVVASGSLPQGVPVDFFRHLSIIVSSKGGRFIVDTSGEALKQSLDGHVYMIKPNLRELRSLTGLDLESEADQEHAAQDLVRQGKCELLVLSMGSAGALAVDRHQIRRFRSPTVPLRSTVGAGDSMVAGIVLRLQQGHDFFGAVAYGVACGAAAIAAPGTQLCKKELAEALFDAARL